MLAARPKHNHNPTQTIASTETDEPIGTPKWKNKTSSVLDHITSQTVRPTLPLGSPFPKRTGIAPTKGEEDRAPRAAAPTRPLPPSHTSEKKKKKMLDVAD
jgi:hypothetical protein